MTMVLTAGQCHKAPIVERLMEQGAVNRQARDRPKGYPEQSSGVKAIAAARFASTSSACESEPLSLIARMRSASSPLIAPLIGNAIGSSD